MTSVQDEEIEALKREALWLVQHEAPLVFLECKRRLVNAIACLSLGGEEENDSTLPPTTPAGKGGNGDGGGRGEDISTEPTADEEYEEASRRLLSFESSGNEIKGFIRLNGWMALEAELRLSFRSRTKSHPTTTKYTISSVNPLPLLQMQNARNFADLGLRRLQEVSFPLGDDHMAELRPLKKVVEDVCSHLTHSKQQLLRSTTDGFPSTEGIAPLRFKPPLPPYLVMEIGICDQDLSVMVYHLQAKSHSKTSSASMSFASSALSLAGGSSLVGYTIKRGNTLMEVADQAEARCRVSNIADAVGLLHRAFIHATELHDKIVALMTAM